MLSCRPGCPWFVIKARKARLRRPTRDHCDGSPYGDDAAQAIASAGNAALYVAEGASDPSLVVDEAVTTTNPDQGNRFRYDPDAHEFVYNWGTKSYSSGKTYTLVAKVRDGGGNDVTHGVTIGLR